MRYLLAIALLLFSVPAFADDANILELKAEIQRLLEQEPLEVIRPVEIVPESVAIPEPVVPFEDVESGADGSARVEPEGRILPALVYVGASWCNPCRQARPTVEQLDREGFNVHFKDADRDARWLRTYNVKSLPTYLLFDEHGRELKRSSGGMSRSGVLAFAGRDSLPDRMFYARTNAVASVALPGTPVRVAVGKPVARAGTTGERQHSHLCSSCGREWWHRSSEANSRSHHCPSCGRTQYVIHRWGR
jgi:thiol-disulfide isomerase/thioredoxin/predicted RNA-binding Zn-ribbon protein involved in translation (DUF1610 family)